MQFEPQFVPPSEPVEPIRVLDESGHLANGVEAPLDSARVLEALRYMMFGRAFDARCWSLQRQGRLGTFAPITGQEASLMGSAMAVDPARDWLVPQYRELPALLRHGYPVERVVLYRQGHPEGGFVPPGVRVMQYQVSLAAQLPHAVGLAWGMKLKEESGVAMVYFGDGASSEGDFHESCNLAGVVDAPVIFFLQNNGWAISTPRAIQTAGSDIAARAPAYGFPGVSVDGNDLMAVYLVTAQAVERARTGGGPTLIEAHTYRMGAHTTADDPSRYVDPEVERRWAERDPILRVQRYLAGLGQWSEATEREWNREIEAEVDDAFARAARFSPPRASDLYEHVFAEPTPSLERQRRWHLQVPDNDSGDG